MDVIRRNVTAKEAAFLFDLRSAGSHQAGLFAVRNLFFGQPSIEYLSDEQEGNFVLFLP